MTMRAGISAIILLTSVNLVTPTQVQSAPSPTRTS
jgi:hypothetical protein